MRSSHDPRYLYVCWVASLLVSVLSIRAQPASLRYQDRSLPIEQRIEDLLKRMTLEEKVGQMNMPCVYEGALGETIAQKTDSVQKFAAGTHLKEIGPGGGFFTLPNTMLHEGTRQHAEFLNRRQKI